MRHFNEEHVHLSVSKSAWTLQFVSLLEKDMTHTMETGTYLYYLVLMFPRFLQNLAEDPVVHHPSEPGRTEHVRLVHPSGKEKTEHGT